MAKRNPKKDKQNKQNYIAKKVKQYAEIIRAIYDANPGLSNAKLAALLEEEIGVKNTQWRHVIGLWKDQNGIKQYTGAGRSVSVVSDQEEDSEYDDRSVGEPMRDEKGKITHYKYHILIRDKEPLSGQLTREEMNKVYRLYSSNDGAGLNRRSVAREFPELTFRDFKRLLRAFNITKDSIPVAPHILEENDADKVHSIIRQSKENVVLKKLEEGRGVYYEKLARKLQKQMYEERYNRRAVIEELNNLIDDEAISEITPIKLKKRDVSTKYAVNMYLADIHTGADALDAQYAFLYDDAEIDRRGDLVIEELFKIRARLGHIDTINLCNLGDSLDGWDRKTTRGGHELSQNMTNKQQARAYFRLLRTIVAKIHENNLCNNISFRAVTDDNHSGDAGWLANEALAMRWELEYPEMEVQVFEKFIEHFVWNNQTFVMMHGKDGHSMSRNMPLTLDDKTENRINEYLDSERIGGNVHVIKGDLHQSSRQVGQRFTYKNCMSFFGSSAYVQLNFGNSPAGCDYDIVFDDGDLLEGVVDFK